MPICSTCKSLPYAHLPSEDEPAFPHQPSLAILEASASTCGLCKLIHEAIQDLLKTIENDRVGSSQRKPGWNTFLYNADTGTTQVTGLGTTLPEVTETPTVEQRFQALRLGSPSTGEGGDVEAVGPLRPWVYGNWWVLDRNPDGGAEAKDKYQLLGMGVRIGTGPELGSAVGNTKGMRYFRGSKIRIRVDDACPMALIAPGRLRTVDAKSKLALARARRWIDECDKYHKCVKASTPLPTRVLDLGDGTDLETVRLLETRGENAKYIALSHCWGASHRITTTKATIQKHKHGIKIRDLPATFRDAVALARGFYVRYLWIDSLCIVQDDLEDWEMEASHMGKVYANSYLTIAASSSTDDSGGCFPSIEKRLDTPHMTHDSESLGHYNVVNASPIIAEGGPTGVEYMAQCPLVYLDYNNGSGKSSRLFFSKEWLPSSKKSQPSIYRIGTFGSVFDPLSREPLGTRGWTLQERLLPRRTIHYATEQTYWECQHHLVAEDGTRFKAAFPTFATILSGQKLSGSQHGIPQGWGLNLTQHHIPQFLNHGRWKDGWIALIQRYSRRNLTYPLDKLPALSGMAKLVEEATSDEYCAGLWKNHVTEDLHWRVYAKEELTSMDPNIQPIYGGKLSDVSTPEGYRAPSWSWAKIDANTLFMQLDFQGIVAEFVDWASEAAGRDPRGRLKSAWIKLKAPLLDITKAPLSHPGRKVSPFGPAVQIQTRGGISSGTAYFDVGPQFPCSALFLDHSNALVLTLSGENGAFQRVGIAHFLATESQNREQGPVGKRNGPIGGEDEKVVVMIV